jgi:retron-type reverse transcriptase
MGKREENDGAIWITYEPPERLPFGASGANSIEAVTLAGTVAPDPIGTGLRIAQRALYARSEKDTAYVFRKLWGLVTDPRNLRMALARVASNRGRRTAGVDGITVARLTNRTDAFIAEVHAELRSGAYRPSPVRRVLIPKIGAPGKFRPLGIPTVKDRVVQAALKNILEPVFEADFFPVSFGFPTGQVGP